MHRTVRTAIAGTAAIAALIAVPTAHAAGRSPASTWAIVASPSIPDVGQSLNAVAAVTDRDAWAVGDLYDRQTGEEVPLVQHWDGTAWRVSPTPRYPGSYHRLTAVAAISSADVWAAGYIISPTGTWRPLLLHWDGSAWKLGHGAPIAGTYNVLTALAATAPGDLWAVGYHNQGTDRVPLIEHWDGSTWARIPAPHPGNYSELYGATAISSTDAWATGEYRTDEGYESLALHWDGASWQQVETPNIEQGGWFEGSTATGSSDVWAVGYTLLAGANSSPLIQRWNGTDWSIVPSPPLVGPYSKLTTIAFASSSSGAAVGETSDRAGEFHPVVEEWNGSTWGRVSVPVPAGMEGFLYGVNADGAGGFWAVGYAYRDAPTLRFATYILRSTPA